MDFHFGATSSEGSEHTIGGKKYPMEISLTFYDGEQFTDIQTAAAAGTMGAMASVSYMVEVGNVMIIRRTLRLIFPSGFFRRQRGSEGDR